MSLRGLDWLSAVLLFSCSASPALPAAPITAPPPAMRPAVPELPKMAPRMPPMTAPPAAPSASSLLRWTFYSTARFGGQRAYWEVSGAGPVVTDRRIPMACRTARSVFSVGFPVGDKAL